MYKHPETGIEFPAAIGVFKRGDPAPYHGSPGEPGVAIPYGAKEIEATLYIRHLAAGATKTSADLLKESLVVARVMEHNPKYTGVRIFESTGENDRFGWRRGAFTARLDGAPILSFLYCRVKKDWAFKLRISSHTPGDRGFENFALIVQDLV